MLVMPVGEEQTPGSATRAERQLSAEIPVRHRRKEPTEDGAFAPSFENCENRGRSPGASTRDFGLTSAYSGQTAMLTNLTLTRSGVKPETQGARYGQGLNCASPVPSQGTRTAVGMACGTPYSENFSMFGLEPDES